jgi:hypothetical protein
VYPAYATYKAVLAPKRPPPAGRSAAAAGLQAEAAREALLKYWAVFGLTCLAERLLEQHIDRLGGGGWGGQSVEVVCTAREAVGAAGEGCETAVGCRALATAL